MAAAAVDGVGVWLDVLIRGVGVTTLLRDLLYGGTDLSDEYRHQWEPRCAATRAARRGADEEQKEQADADDDEEDDDDGDDALMMPQADEDSSDEAALPMDSYDVATPILNSRGVI